MVILLVVVLEKNDNLEYAREEEYKEVMAVVSEDIVLSNIIDQIKDLKNLDTIYNRTSLFDFFEERLNFLYSKYSDDSIKMNEVTLLANSISDSIIYEIGKTIGIDFEISEDAILTETKLQYAKSLYNFFVVDIAEKLEVMTFNYIIKYKDTFRDLFSTLNKDDKKNFSYTYLKNSIDNEYTPMIFHMNDILDTIEIPHNEEFIEMIVKDDPEIDNYFIQKIIIDNQFVEINHKCNFVDTFKQLITTNNNLIRNVKNKLVNTLNK